MLADPIHHCFLLNGFYGDREPALWHTTFTEGRAFRYLSSEHDCATFTSTSLGVLSSP